EDVGRDAGPVRHAQHGQLRLVAVVGDAGDRYLLHGGILLHDPRPLRLVEGGADVDRDTIALGELDRADLQDLRPEARELEHLVVGDARQLPRLRDDARVARVDAVDVGIDLADVRLERGGEGDGARIRAAATERGYAPLPVHALKAGDDGDRAGADRFPQPLDVDADDPRPAVRAVGLDADL